MSIDTPAILAFFGLIGTCGLGLSFLRLIGLTKLPRLLSLAASYPTGIAIFSMCILTLNHYSVPISLGSWAITILGLLLLTSIFYSTRPLAPRIALNALPTIDNEWWRHWSPVAVVVITLLAIHFSFFLLNNLNRPIFPWDALTTWMYRAKLWAINDALLPLIFAPDWLAQTGTEGYPIYANHYPKLLSLYIASMSALTEGWNSEAASLPWSFAWLCLLLMMYGVVKVETDSVHLALAAGFALCSLPLLNAHVALAGYADIWMALTSGCGLMMLLLWSQKKNNQTLTLALLLLTTGAQLKNEGWLWAGLAMAFILIQYLTERGRLRALLLGVPVAIGLLLALQITHVSLGPLGSWGVSDSTIDIGPLGSYLLRPYNPLPNYWSALIEQPNFHLMLVLFLVSVISLLSRRDKYAGAVCVMTGLILTSQIMIFGVSSFSHYAESGTAINRLLIHFLPVTIFIIAIGLWPHLPQLQRNVPLNRFSEVKIGALGTCLALTLLASVFFVLNPSLLLPVAEKIDIEAEQMSVMLGQVEKVDGGLRILPSDVPVSVLRAPLQPQADSKKHIGLLDVEAEDASHVRLYWINQDEPSVVHSVTPNQIGRSIIDLAIDKNWGHGAVLEWGVIVTPEGFGSTIVKSVSLSEGLTVSETPALLATWFTPRPPDQRSLNFLRSQDYQFSNINLLISFVAMLCVAVVVATFTLGTRWEKLRMAGISTICALWILSDLIWLRHLASWASTSVGLSPVTVTEAVSSGEWINNIRGLLEKTLAPFDEIIVVPATDDYEFEARKIPFDLLPKKVAFARYGRLKQIQGSARPLILIGTENEQLDFFTQRILHDSVFPMEVFLARDGLRVLVPNALQH